EREFYIEVDVYLSPKTTTALKKPPVQRKKTEKRDSRTLSILTTDDNQKKVKEKTSWLNLTRGNGTEWRHATCRLTEESENCTLNVYLGETTLFQMIYVHTLKFTDIRPADRSLFPKDNVLGIHCLSSQRWMATSTTEPLYLALPSSEALHTWLALLRSYASAEIYGQTAASEDGLYRLWRQVDITCAQGRNIIVDNPRGLQEALVDSSKPGRTREGTDDTDASTSVSEVELYCDLFINNTLCGRTAVKRSLGAPEWHEQFVFPDMPQLEQLTVLVYQEKRPLAKPIMVGSVHISLANFRRGEIVEGWFPVLKKGASIAALQVGQVRLKIKIEELIILPGVAYSRALDILDTRNYLDWMDDLESKLKIKHLSGALSAIAISRDKLLRHILEVADREIDGTLNPHNTLFRGNTALTKTAEQLMGWYGRLFLEQSLGNSIRRLCMEGVAIEVDPARTNAKDAERDVERLRSWCADIWKDIYGARAQCPEEFRHMFQRVRELVALRYPDQQKDNLPWQAVNALCFLRYFIPAILYPHLHGLCPGMPDVRVQRTLTLIAKTLQSLANFNANVQKEVFMGGVKTFLEESRSEMFDYVLAVSTPSEATRTTQPSEELQTRTRATRDLNKRKEKMPALQREALPLPPHPIDVPRQLAIISAALTRQAAQVTPVRVPTPGWEPLEKLSARFADVEREALFRVSSLA
ncbi:Rho GTPase activation protein, partial [Vararia minispora EC-137]